MSPKRATGSTLSTAMPPTDDEEAKAQVAQILAAMIYGDEGQFFVYDYDGNALVIPRDTDRINHNWTGEPTATARQWWMN